MRGIALPTSLLARYFSFLFSFLVVALKKTDESKIHLRNAQPSKTDSKPENNAGYTQPSAVLGYERVVKPLPSGQIGGTPEVEFVKKIGFYTPSAQINKTDIKFSDFMDAVKKINKQ